MRYFKFISFAVGILLLLSCAGPYIRSREMPREEMQRRQEIVECAKGLVGTKNLASLNKCFKNDCSGFVIGVYRLMGYRVDIRSHRKNRSLSEMLFLSLQDKGMAYREYQPNIGDAVFFKNTTDVVYDRITHMGLVEEIFPDGTITIIHYSSGMVTRIRMNLKDPYREKNSRGKVINNYLKRDDAGAGKRNILAGALFHSYGDIYNYCRRNKR
ncbi:MAG: CHAP domain-containing protein [Candidatus Edwardsbacteria bacterium]|nr:CHAP domain-containing protein [Candidatus Edwardsbacteria bacterium]MBU1575626.1 CHAP domain-containing protein [Candidatus Edwardsbacteria bacterium]MBU2462996.1 CHAP domain-containing protein [Candidatus Edwardsbacteria bacterium]MBU2594593.1 CHAP domain-containing protein [Candidatus Edwardsbacteria bacterium]